MKFNYALAPSRTAVKVFGTTEAGLEIGILELMACTLAIVPSFQSVSFTLFCTFVDIIFWCQCFPTTAPPCAFQVIRRSGPEEKVLVICRRRPGHYCATAMIVVIILIWDGVARPLADFAYCNIAQFVPKHGEPTERRCGTNEE